MTIRYRSKFHLVLPDGWSTPNNTECETRIFHSPELTVFESLYEHPDKPGQMTLHIRVNSPYGRPTRNQVDKVLAAFVGPMYLNALTFSQTFALDYGPKSEDIYMTFLRSDVAAFLQRGKGQLAS